MSAYADTSFVVSLYIQDANSAEAARRMNDLQLPVSISLLGRMELANALQLQLFRGQLGLAEIRSAHSAFQADARSGLWLVRPVTATVYERAEQLALQWTSRLGTRTLDILHMATALAFEADAFHTFDERQSKLAQAVNMNLGK